MSEFARTIVSQLRRFIGNRRNVRRREVRLPFSMSVADRRIRPNGARGVPTISGHTLDVSATGLALNVPAIRIEEHYLVGESRRLQLNLELPDGPVRMQVAPVRYESLEEHQSETGYAIGVRITEMSEQDRMHFNEYIKHLKSRGIID
ncbi:MAG TPA: PilZ domain-containing protein [Pyrinomonadaceae bacterium]|nr:PilZ domain-containing protein [Pyrinomonadaceae bacterium]